MQWPRASSVDWAGDTDEPELGREACSVGAIGEARDTVKGRRVVFSRWCVTTDPWLKLSVPNPDRCACAQSVPMKARSFEEAQQTFTGLRPFSDLAENPQGHTGGYPDLTIAPPKVTPAWLSRDGADKRSTELFPRKPMAQ